MTKMFVFARLMFVVLGLYVLQQVLNFLYNLPIEVYQNFGAPSLILTLLITIPIFVFGCIATYYLLFKSDKWSQILIEPVNEDSRPAETVWIAATFRLTAFFCGLMILASSMKTIVNAVGFILYGPKLIIDAIAYGEFDENFPLSFESLLQSVVKLFQAALGIYLILGAPHFIRWQIGKYDVHLIKTEAQND